MRHERVPVGDDGDGFARVLPNDRSARRDGPAAFLPVIVDRLEGDREIGGIPIDDGRVEVAVQIDVSSHRASSSVESLGCVGKDCCRVVRGTDGLWKLPELRKHRTLPQAPWKTRDRRAFSTATTRPYRQQRVTDVAG